ncbi:MAG: hydrogenase assembly protein HupF, partial [Acidimicrobiales bacterium]
MTTRTVAAIDCARQPVEAALWLARAFVEGRRLAIAAPGGEDHAHHVAVEFVHPAIAGTRSLPAVVTGAAEAADESDVLLLIGQD